MNVVFSWGVIVAFGFGSVRVFDKKCNTNLSLIDGEDGILNRTGIVEGGGETARRDYVLL
jgi:hypothetical protein